MPRGDTWRRLTMARAAFGAALLVEPEPLLRAAPHRQIDNRSELVARVLGARHLAEALLLGRRQRRGTILLSGTIDAVHAMTAFGYAAADRRHRRLALTNGVVASAFAAACFREALRA